MNTDNTPTTNSSSNTKNIMFSISGILQQKLGWIKTIAILQIILACLGFLVNLLVSDLTGLICSFVLFFASYHLLSAANDIASLSKSPDPHALKFSLTSIGKYFKTLAIFYILYFISLILLSYYTYAYSYTYNYNY